MRVFKTILSLITVTACLWALGFSVFAASALVMKPQKQGQATDAIIVLTGGKNRIESGLRIFADRLSTQLFITGVHEYVSKDEILNRHNGKALPECCITLGYEATTTTENAQEAKEWLAGKKFKTIRLVTSNYHMPRALLEFHHAIPEIAIIPNPIMQPDITPHDEYFWIVTFIEYHKTVFRFLDMTFKGLR